MDDDDEKEPLFGTNADSHRLSHPGPMMMIDPCLETTRTKTDGRGGLS